MLFIKNKCYLSLKSNFILILFLTISLLSISLCKLDEQDKELKIKNILEREKLRDADDWKKESKYTIDSKISQYYSNVTEIYISVIDLKLKNSFILSDNIKEDYYTSYENLLGPTAKYFPLLDLGQINSTHAEFSQEDEEISISYKNKSEILIHTIYSIKDSTKILFIRNLFMNNFEKLDYEYCANNINIWLKINSELKFFDANLLLDKEYYKNCVESRTVKNEILFYDVDDKIIYTNKEISFVNDSKILYEQITKENNKIKIKIERKRILNKTLRKILYIEERGVNI